MEIKGDRIILSTGRDIGANNGIVGLCPKGEIYGGYDDIIHLDGWDNEMALTDDELMEIASYMVASWEKVIIDALNRQRCG